MNKDRVILNDPQCRELVPGGLYFDVGYRGSGVNLPEITSLVYLGVEMTDASDEEPSHPLHIFKKVDSYQEIGGWSELPDERQRAASHQALQGYDTRSVIGVYDLEGLIGCLQRLQKLISLGRGWVGVLPDDPWVRN